MCANGSTSGCRSHRINSLEQSVVSTVLGHLPGFIQPLAAHFHQPVGLSPLPRLGRCTRHQAHGSQQLFGSGQGRA